MELKRFGILMVLLLGVFVFLIFRNERETQEMPLACLSLNVMEDTFNQRRTQIFTELMEGLGYRVQAAYCENNINKQLIQLENMIAQEVSLIMVSPASWSDAYEETMKKAQERGCKVIVMRTQEVEYCDVQPRTYTINRGAAVCRLLKDFLDREYPDAETGSVSVLLLENSSSLEYIHLSSGFKLIKEKFLRYYDEDALDFVHESGDGTVWYPDEEGNLQKVEEESGGLILDEDGYAIPNPFYDERVTLYYAENRQIQTSVEGSAAIDAFVASAGGADLSIVLACSAGAAVAANEQLLFYSQIGMLNHGPDQLAVFGVDDADESEELLMKSVTNDSLYRGYVSYGSLEDELQGLVSLALESEGETLYYDLKVWTNTLDAEGKLVTEEGVSVPLADPDLFFRQSKEEG